MTENERPATDSGKTGPASEGSVDAEPLTPSAPAPETGTQKGFQVVADTPRGGHNKIIWTALLVVIGILIAYAAGLIR